jgi:hypothetical protein
MVVGCGSDLTADEACTRIAQDRCTRLQTCSASDLARRWTDLTTCEQREKLSCQEALAAPKTANTPSITDACAAALATEDCAAFLSAVDPPAACMVQHGTLAVGAACSFAAQCGTGFCAVAPDALCGTCAPQPMPGDSCATQGCGQTMLCVASTQQCQVPVGSGVACSTALPCDQGLACVIATGATTGTCMPQGATVGAACDARRLTAADCDPAAGLVCDRSSNMCAMQPLAPAGATCGEITTVFTGCTAGATCVRATGSTTGTCIAPAADGAACDSVNGPSCLFPARCVPSMPGVSTGTCQLPGSVICM